MVRYIRVEFVFNKAFVFIVMIVLSLFTYITSKVKLCYVRDLLERYGGPEKGCPRDQRIK